MPFSSPAAFTALADNHISHNSSLGYLGSVESKPAYPVPPQVTPSRYSPIPRHMMGDEDFTRWVPGMSLPHPCSFSFPLFASVSAGLHWWCQYRAPAESLFVGA